MSDKAERVADELDVSHPLIKQIGDLTAMLTKTNLTIVYPESTGWKQQQSEPAAKQNSSFCKLIQSSKEGAKHCRMCHIMMTVAACSNGAAEQRCHAGSTVLVCSAAKPNDESMAVLSTCLFSSEDAWEEVKARGIKLGIDLKRMRKAFLELPRLSKEEIETLKSSMQTMGYALQIVRQNKQLCGAVKKLQHRPDQVETLESFLANSAWATSQKGKSTKDKDKPLLVHVVCELIEQRPDLPLTVKEVAAAARLTPNHFTTLFSEHAGKSFNEYLTEQRMKRAMKLLRNPTLTIGEIARLCGYEDPGYFTRRFNKLTGVSPRIWRNRHTT